MRDAKLDGHQRAVKQARQQRRAAGGCPLACARWRRGTTESGATVSRGHVHMPGISAQEAGGGAARGVAGP